MIPCFTDNRISLINSSTDPIIFCSVPSSFIQIGIGTPQYLDLDKFQSFACASQFPNLPSPVDFGFQLIDLLKLTIFSL